MHLLLRHYFNLKEVLKLSFKTLRTFFFFFQKTFKEDIFKKMLHVKGCVTKFELATMW